MEAWEADSQTTGHYKDKEQKQRRKVNENIPGSSDYAFSEELQMWISFKNDSLTTLDCLAGVATV